MLDAHSSLDVQTPTLSLPMRETPSSTQQEVKSDDNNFTLKVSLNSAPACFQVKQFIALYLFSNFTKYTASGFSPSYHVVEAPITSIRDCTSGSVPSLTSTRPHGSSFFIEEMKADGQPGSSQRRDRISEMYN